MGLLSTGLPHIVSEFVDHSLDKPVQLGFLTIIVSCRSFQASVVRRPILADGMLRNKPAAQAAGAGPSRFNSLGIIPPFIKIAVTFDSMKRFRYHLRFRFSLKN